MIDKNILQEYQDFTESTAIYPQATAFAYLVSGLASEAGEVAGVHKKWLRQDYKLDEFRERLHSELGDLMWYVFELCRETDTDIETVLRGNMHKLSQRKQEGTLKGDGEERISETYQYKSYDLSSEPDYYVETEINKQDL
jgi:NTP pyrophosphatase (non-canonical NTP hydrolase)